MPIDVEDTASHTAIPGAPAWVTPELLTDTIETWQPYYTNDLTESDSLEILLSVSRLLDALQNQVTSSTETNT